MRLSVIIATYQRREFLAACLDSLSRQSRVPDEVIVVTVASDSASRNFLGEYMRAHAMVREAVTGRPDIVAAENAGLKEASGDIVCFIDDDAVAPVTWVEMIARRYDDDPSLGGVGGPVIPVVGGKPVIEATAVFARMNWYGKRVSNSSKVPLAVQEVDFLRGANMSFRKELVRGFDTRLLPYWRRFEDDVCLSIKEQGFRIICDPALQVLHFQAPEGRELVDKSRETAIGLHHNSLYVKLKHTKGGARKLACALFEFTWGDETTPGCLQIIWHGLAHGKMGCFRETGLAFKGKIRGIKTYVSFRKMLP